MDEYISREAAIKELRKVYEDEYPTASGDFDEYASHDVPNVLRNMKAADVQPVRFARWIDLDNRILCSGCGAGYDDSDEVKQNTYIFCPNCGARMTKDGDTDA